MGRNSRMVFYGYPWTVQPVEEDDDGKKRGTWAVSTNFKKRRRVVWQQHLSGFRQASGPRKKEVVRGVWATDKTK